MNDPHPPTKTRRRKGKRGWRGNPYDVMRTAAATHQTYYERLAFAVVGFALIEASGIGTDARKRQYARAWLASERGIAWCLALDIDAGWFMRRCGERERNGRKVTKENPAS